MANEKESTGIGNYISEKFSNLKNYLPDKKTLGLVGALALSGFQGANAQNNEAQNNTIYSKNHEYSAACDGVTLKRFAEDLHLNTDSKINPDEYFQLHAKEGDLSWRVRDSREVLQNTITYLKRDLDSMDSQSRKERQACINFYENFLNETPESDEFTKRMLGASLEDKVIDAGDFLVRDGDKRQWVIKDGIYSLVAKSPTIKDDEGDTFHKSNTVPITTNVNLQAYEIVGDTIRSLKPYADWSEDEKDQHARDFAFFEEGRKLEEVSEGVYVARDPKEVEEEVKDIEKHVKDPRSIGLITDGFYGQNGLVGGSLGVNYGWFNLLVNYSGKNDEIVEELSVPLSRGREGVGTTREVDFNSIGASLEIQPLPYLFFGAGVNNWTYSTEVEESIISQYGDVIKTNSNSRSESDISKRFYGGFNIPLTDRLDLRLSGGNDSEVGWFGSGGFKIDLNRNASGNGQEK